MSGPPPKRTSQRRRVNKPEVDIDHAPGASEVEIPKADRSWHRVAKQWFEALKLSGQSQFYEPSDWATAYAIAEAMSREFKPQPIGTTDDGKPIMANLPPKGASLAAWLKAMTALMVTEGDRRRLRLELTREAVAPQDPEVAKVARLDTLRGRLTG